MWVRGKRRVAWLGFLLFAWSHLTGLSTAEGPDAENQPPENIPEESFRKGIASYKEERYEEAIAHLETSLRTPTEWEEYPYFYLLQSHWKAEHVAEALGFCKAFQQRFPKSPLIDRVAYIEAEGYQKSSAYWLASRAYESYLEKKEFAEVRLRYGEVAGATRTVFRSLCKLSENPGEVASIPGGSNGQTSCQEDRRRASRIDRVDAEGIVPPGGGKPLPSGASLYRSPGTSTRNSRACPCPRRNERGFS